jgi:glycosyltransferase involved in cell wall biosynthesis
MGEAARAIAVERYAWPRIAGRMVEIYERVTQVESGLRAA